MKAPKLTPREKQIRDLIVRGLVHKQIAAALGIAHHTVRVYAQQLYQKYGVHSRGRLVAKLAAEIFQ